MSESGTSISSSAPADESGVSVTAGAAASGTGSEASEDSGSSGVRMLMISGRLPDTAEYSLNSLRLAANTERDALNTETLRYSRWKALTLLMVSGDDFRLMNS